MNLIKYRNFRELNKAFKLTGFCFLFIILYLFQCADRDRSNIFDPYSGIDSLDIKLYITSADSLITINWSAPYKVHSTGYKLYRKADNEENFRLIASPESNQLVYLDEDVSFDVSYKYYITVQGEESESPPSQILSVTPGPVTFVVLDLWGFAIYRLTYDLQHILQTRYTAWRAENLAFDHINNLILITYPQLSYLEIFSRTSGATELSSSDFSRPFDCIYNDSENKFWLTDSSGFLYSIDGLTGTSQLFDQNLNQPTQIIQSDQGIFVLDTKVARILKYNNSGERDDIIEQMNENPLIRPIYLNCAKDADELYIIDKVSDENRILYRYSLLTDSAEIIYQNKYINCIQIDISDNSVWVSVNNPENSVLMQLSYEGIRLNEITGFSGILDFKLNFETHTIIAVDHVENLVKHIRPNSSIIGVFDDGVYPSKVYSE